MCCFADEYDDYGDEPSMLPDFGAASEAAPGKQSQGTSDFVSQATDAFQVQLRLCSLISPRYCGFSGPDQLSFFCRRPLTQQSRLANKAGTWRSRRE